jgi:hypothetical protein
MTHNSRDPAVVVFLLFSAGIISPAALAAQRDSAAVAADCRNVLKSLGGKTSDRSNCTSLATLLGTILDSLYTTGLKSDTSVQLTPRKLQSTRAGEANISGVPGQTESAPSAQPSPLASATLSGAGTDAGTKAIAAISINPVTLFGGGDTVAAARWSRVTDLTVLVPVANTSGTPGRLGYFGVRARVNFTGLNAGDDLLSQLNAAFARAIREQSDLTFQLREALKSLPDSAAIAQCATAVLASSYGDSPGACHGRVTLAVRRDVYDTLHRAIVRAREKADSRYLGLDLRFDTGDPTLARDPTKEVTALQAGLAFGRRSLKANLNKLALGVQGRLGVRYSDPKAPGDSVVWSLDGALGFETSRLMSNDQPVRFSTGLEFRYANKSDIEAERNQTDHLVVRGGLAIPLVGGTSVSVGFTGPLTGEVSPDLSVNFNWGLLMSSLVGDSSGQ